MLKSERGFKDQNLIYCRVQWWNISVISTEELGKPQYKVSPTYHEAFLIPSSSSLHLLLLHHCFPPLLILLSFSFLSHHSLPNPEHQTRFWLQLHAAAAVLIFGSWVSHPQISLCSLSVSIYGTRAHAAAWLRMKRGLKKPQGQRRVGGGAWEAVGAFHNLVARSYPLISVRLRLLCTELKWIDCKAGFALATHKQR